MSFKYTPATLRKLEQLLEAAAYTIRYEKGAFQSGACLLDDRKVVVVNRFLPTEGRINALLDLLARIAPETAGLPADLRAFYHHATVARTDAATVAGKS